MVSMRKARVIGLLALTVLLAACGSSSGRAPGGPGAANPTTALERFLFLANAEEYGQMSWLFGTREGAFANGIPREEAETRMFLLSCLLRHDQFAIRSERPLPGSGGEALRYEVELSKPGWEGAVPFTVVQGPGQRWFIEQVGLDVLTRSTAPLPEGCEATGTLRPVR